MEVEIVRLNQGDDALVMPRMCSMNRSGRIGWQHISANPGHFMIVAVADGVVIRHV